MTTVVKGLGLQEDSKGVDVALPTEYGAEEGDQELDPQEAKKYRSLAATVNFLALDRPDLQFTAGVLGRTMAKPTTRSWANLKKTGRYLLEHPRLVFKYVPCELGQTRELLAYGDSDWAGCKVTQKSVSGGGDHHRRWVDQGMVEPPGDPSPFERRGRVLCELEGRHRGVGPRVLDAGFGLAG